MGKSKTGLSIVNLMPKGTTTYSIQLCRPETHMPGDESGKDCTGSLTFPDIRPPADSDTDLPAANGHLPGISEVTWICCDFPDGEIVSRKFYSL